MLQDLEKISEKTLQFEAKVLTNVPYNYIFLGVRRFCFSVLCIVKVHRCTLNTKSLVRTNKLKIIGSFVYIAHQIHVFVVSNIDALIIVTHRFYIVCVCSTSSL
jgi:hypothetical protein